MKELRRSCWIALVCLLAGLLGLAPRQACAQGVPLGDPLDRAVTYFARYFECNGTFQERYDTWWLSTANPFKFRRHFTATWYFEDVEVSSIPGAEVILRLDLAVYTNAKESGGKPTAATVDLLVQNPDNEEEIAVLNARVEMNADETSIPTYVYVPQRMLTADGRLVVELHGLGQIGVGQPRLRLLIPLEPY